MLSPNYPTDPDGNSVKAAIGGDVTSSWLGPNTCVIRMSKAFNYAGTDHEIPAGHKGLGTVRGADGKHYAYRVTEFVKYLHQKYGPPDIVRRGSDISITPFQGATGLIVWHISGWSDATGHFTLWDGTTGLYEGTHDYFVDFATSPPGPFLTSVEFWSC